MIYSRFDDQTGTYDLFSDRSTHALNGDFPVPSLGPDAGGIGVPATEAGRPVPRGAKRIGTSWQARGLVAASAPNGASLGGMTKGEVGYYAMPIIVVTGIATLAWVLHREQKKGTFSQDD